MATHIESFQLSDYRGIKKLELNNLGAVNVFVGDNNVGKTSVLEAIQLLCAPNKYSLVQLARQREKYRAGLSVGLVDSLCYLFNMGTNPDRSTSLFDKVLMSWNWETKNEVRRHFERIAELL